MSPNKKWIKVSWAITLAAISLAAGIVIGRATQPSLYDQLQDYQRRVVQNELESR